MFPAKFFFSQWLLQINILYGAENACQVNLQLVVLGKMLILDIEVSAPIISQQQNTDDHDSPALELHAITVVDWLEPRLQCTQDQLLL